MEVHVNHLPLNVNAKRNRGSECNGTKKKPEQTSITVNQASSAGTDVRMVPGLGLWGGGITKEFEALRSYANRYI